MSQMCSFPSHGVSRLLAGTLSALVFSCPDSWAAETHLIWLHQAGGQVSSEPQAPSILDVGLAPMPLLHSAGQAKLASHKAAFSQLLNCL